MHGKDNKLMNIWGAGELLVRGVAISNEMKMSETEKHKHRYNCLAIYESCSCVNEGGKNSANSIPIPLNGREWVT
jgi:hypothetical protein